MGHERYDRSVHIEGSSNRSFGLVFTAFFTSVGLVPLLAQKAPRVWALVVAGLLLVVALVTPSLLAPLNRLWMKFGELLGTVVSPIALGIVFYIVITPMALIMRLRGHTSLRLRFDRTAPSYWIERQPPGPPPATLKDQF